MTIQGAITAMITPFREGRVDESRLREQIEFQITSGIDGLVPVGTTGESPTLDMAEHKRVIQLTVECAKRRVPVIAGVGGNSTSEAIELHKFAREVGAAAGLSVNPYYNKPSQEGLYRHFMTLAEKVELPIVLYNVPGRTSVNMLPATVARLRKASHRFTAVKEASANLDAVSEIRSLCDITIISGDDSLTLPMMSIGAAGVVSVVSNVFPAEVKQLTRLALSGNFTEAAQVHHRLFPFTKSVFADGSPGGVKCAMHLLGRDSGELRLPLVSVSEQTRAAIEQQLKTLVGK